MFALKHAATSRTAAARAFSTSSRRADLAKLTLIGRLGNAPEVKTTKNDKEYMTYAVATQQYLPPDANGERVAPKTTWHKIISFSDTANKRLKELKKGSKVYVETTFDIREPEPEADPATPNGQRQIFLRHETMRVISSPKDASEASGSEYRLD